jgi:hypothetical protein
MDILSPIWSRIEIEMKISKTFTPGDRPYRKADYENNVLKITMAKNNRS